MSAKNIATQDGVLLQRGYRSVTPGFLVARFVPARRRGTPSPERSGGDRPPAALRATLAWS